MEDMPADARLAWHQTRSKPTMDNLHAWLQHQFDDKLLEPNSASPLVPRDPPGRRVKMCRDQSFFASLAPFYPKPIFNRRPCADTDGSPDPTKARKGSKEKQPAQTLPGHWHLHISKDYDGSICKQFGSPVHSPACGRVRLSGPESVL
jgi:hypothetical protein